MNPNIFEGSKTDFNDAFEDRRSYFGQGFAITPPKDSISETYAHFNNDGRVAAISVVDLAYDYRYNIDWIKGMRNQCVSAKGRRRSSNELILEAVPIGREHYEEMRSVFSGEYFGGRVPVQTLVLPRGGGTPHVAPGLIESFVATDIREAEDFFSFAESDEVPANMFIGFNRHPALGEDFSYRLASDNSRVMSLARSAVNNAYYEILHGRGIPHLARPKLDRSKRGNSARSNTNFVYQRAEKAPAKMKNNEHLVVDVSRCLNDITGAVGVLNVAAELLRTASLAKKHAFLEKHLQVYDKIVLQDNSLKVG